MHSLPRTWRRSLVAAVSLVGAAALPAAAAARPHHDRDSHHGDYVYVNDNTAGTNTVAGFTREPNGRLTPLPGSPFTAGGAGTGSGLASQGAIQVSSNGRYVLAEIGRAHV